MQKGTTKKSKNKVAEPVLNNPALQAIMEIPPDSLLDRMRELSWCVEMGDVAATELLIDIASKCLYTLLRATWDSKHQIAADALHKLVTEYLSAFTGLTRSRPLMFAANARKSIH